MAVEVFPDPGLTVTKTDVGLGNVTNDAQVPLSTVTTAGDLVIATGNAAVTRLNGSELDGRQIKVEVAKPAGSGGGQRRGGGGGGFGGGRGGGGWRGDR